MSRGGPARLSVAIAYLRANYRQMILDAVILASWIVLATEVFRLVRVPRWAQYLLLFTGVVAYERVTRTWERPGGVDG